MQALGQGRAGPGLYHSSIASRGGFAILQGWMGGCAMNRKLLGIAALGLALACGAGAHGHNKRTAGDKVREVLPEAERVFTREEVTLVHNYFQDNRSGLPPGLAKREQLPLGLQKHLERDGTLPPGLQKKVQPLPPELERRMRVLPTGYRRVVIAGNVIMMNEKTSRIYDIVRNVIR